MAIQSRFASAIHTGGWLFSAENRKPPARLQIETYWVDYGGARSLPHLVEVLLQNKAVADVTFGHALNRLGAFLHGKHFDPWFDLLLGSKTEHV